MATTPKKIRVASNPHRHATSSRPHAAKKKAGRMAKTGIKKAAKKAKKNPFGKKTVQKSKSRRNPSGIMAAIGTPKDVLIAGVAGLASAVATRQLPQMLMTTDNEGWVGYAANAGVALAATYAAGVFVGPVAAKAAFVGGIVILLDRILTEQVSPIGQYLTLSGVGDATAMTKLGTIGDGYYIHPTVVDSNGKPIIPHEVSDAALAAMISRYPQLAAPAPAAGRSNVGRVNSSSRFQGRFQ
jgi:hypothetical protein